MLFNSFEFLFVYFPLVTLGYYFLKQKIRWAWLLAASCFFYMFFIPEYIFILFSTIIIDYSAGIFIEDAKTGIRKKAFLWLSIVFTSVILLIFKYYNFFIGNLNSVLGTVNNSPAFSTLSIILPIGLSFHTFQSLSYVIEVYRGKQKAERHFGIYSLYVMFYPQLVAGPIERPQNIIHQLHEEKKLTIENLVIGIRLIIWGLFKKVVVADSIAPLADMIFNNYSDHTSYALYLGALFFSIQIYCDFSGYSDIAIGTARVMGINLMENFNIPYISTSIKEFWSRWHISLSSWFRDYLYFPLGGNKISSLRTTFNQVVVFMVSGLWHGANWTFVFWGFLHSAYLVTEIAFKKWNFNAVPKIIKQVYIFHIALIAWIFFRADTISVGFDYVADMFSSATVLSLGNLISEISFGKIAFKLLLLFIFLISDRRISKYLRESRNYFSLRSSLLVNILLVLLITIGQWSHVNFIYFQF